MSHIGTIVKELRLAKGLSRSELAKQVFCSESTIKRIECNNTKISPDTMTQLNNFFKIELYDYYSIINRYGDYDTYIFCMELYKAIENRKIDDIDKYLLDCNLNKFQVLDEPSILVLYSKALSYYYNKNYSTEKNIQYILTNLHIKNYTEITELLNGTKDVFSLFSLLNLLSILYEQLKEFDKSYFISKLLFEHFNSSIFNDKYFLDKYRDKFQRQYVAICNNYADALLKNGEYQKSFDICNMGIVKARDFQVLQSVEYLHSLLVELHYKFGNNQETNKALDDFILFCDFKGNEDYKHKKLNDFKNLNII